MRWEYILRGVIFLSPNLDFIKSSEYYERCERIWSSYKLYSICATTPRVGFELVGISYPSRHFGDVAASYYCRGESTLEHMAKTAWLTSTFASNFPDYFGGMLERGVAAWAWRMLIVSLIHDTGEIVTGDIPDDGRPEHDTKDGVEMEIVCDLSNAFNVFDGNMVVDGFRHLQQKNSPEGKALYALDKLEAVLTLVLLEFYGKFGNVANKPEETNLDKYYAKIAGTNNATDVWALHLVDHIWCYPDYIVDPALTLLKVALLDARGVLPDWWNKEYLESNFKK